MSIKYNDVELERKFGLVALGRGTYGAPERDIERVHVPGRNGDLLFDNGGYLDIDVTYPCSISENFADNVQKLKQHLYKSPGYHVLTDSYHPDEYRLAEFRGPFDPDVFTARNNDGGNFDLTFHCKPQRFLSKDKQYVTIVQMSADESTITVMLSPLGTEEDATTRMDTIRITPTYGSPSMTAAVGYAMMTYENGESVLSQVTREDNTWVLTEPRSDYDRYAFIFGVSSSSIRVGFNIDINGTKIKVDTVGMDRPYASLDLTGYCGPAKLFFYFTTDFVEDTLTLTIMNGDKNTYTMTFTVPGIKTLATIDFDTYTIMGMELTDGQWPKIDGYDDVRISIVSSSGRLLYAQADTREWRI